MKFDIMKGVIYIVVKIFTYSRVSTELQVEKNTQLNQQKAISDFLKTQSEQIEIIGNFEDLGISGKSKNREQFNIMCSRLKEVNAIAVYDLDRLARDLEIGLELMQLLMRYDVKIYEARTQSVKNLLENDNDQLLYMIGTWYNALERKKILDRQKLGIQRYKKEKGRWGPNKKKLKLDKYNKLREMGIPKTTIAKIMGIHIRTLYIRLKELGIPVGDSIRKKKEVQINA